MKQGEWCGYPGDAGGPELYRSPAIVAKFEEQCRKAQATQAAVDARINARWAELEARERAAAKAQQALDWDSEVCRKAGVLPGDIEARKRAQEACGGVRNPQASPGPLEDFVEDYCGGADAQAVNRPYRAHPWAPELVLAGNFDAQGAAIVEQDCLERDAPHRVALLTVAPLPDGRGKR